MSLDYPNGSKVSMIALYVAQTLASFATTAAQMLVFALVLQPGVCGAARIPQVLALLATVLAVPYLAFSPLFAWLVERFSTRTVLRLGLWMLLLCLVSVAAALHWRSISLALGSLLLLATRSAIASAAKRAMVGEVTPARKYYGAVLLLEMLTLAAIVAGAYVGVAALDWFGEYNPDVLAAPWRAAERTVVGLIAVAGLALVVSRAVRPTAARLEGALPRGLLTRPINHLRELLRLPRLRTTALGIMFFYWFAGILVLGLLAASHGRVATPPEDGGGAGLALALLLCCGMGALAGCFVAGALARGRMELGLVPFGAAGMAVGAWLARGLPLDSGEIRSALVAVGFFAGMFLAPLYVNFQHNVTPGRRTRMIGALNLFRGLGGVAAGAAFYLTATKLHWGLGEQCTLLAGMAVLAAVVALWVSPEHVIVLLFRVIGRVLYRLRIEGLENLPAGGALVISNHISYVDAIVLQVLFPRRLWFLSVHGPSRRGLRLWFYRISGVIPLSATKATEGLRLAIRKIKEGELVCVFPEGQVTRTGALMEIRKGFEVLARRAEAPVVPVFIDSLWGSVFTYSGQKIIWKLPERLPFAVVVKVGAPLPSATVDPALARQALLDLGEAAYQERVELRRHLGREVLRSLARHPWKTILIDCTTGRREMSAGMLLAAAATYARQLRRTVPERRVGIVLPPGIGGYVANLAVVLAGKVPVNLNFTVGRETIEANMRLGEVETVISATAVQEKVNNFPWPKKTRDLRAELAAVGKLPILFRLAMVWLLPSRLLAAIWRVPAVGDRAEAALLFTSGSAGDPKGVPLAHRNILANCGQIYATGILPRQETMLSCLPIFHSYGFSVMLWYALMRGLRIVTLPSPLDAKRIIEVIEQERVTIFVSAPTFMRPLVKRAEPAQLRSVRFMVSGAEKLPLDLYELCRRKFGIHIYQGYGLTETTPVASVNIVDPAKLPKGVKPQQGHRVGSVGRLMAGITARVIDPDTGAVLPPNRSGTICLKGANVFAGYLTPPPRRSDAVHDGWFVTGDFGRFDEEGFLYIEGRLSRFSKVGGEMVPHLAVEQKIGEALALEATDVQKVVVLGIPDAAKGEALVLLTTEPLDLTVLRERLAAAGVPNLWIPKIVRRVDAIPMLDSGKCDLKACQALATAVLPASTGGGTAGASAGPALHSRI